MTTELVTSGWASTLLNHLWQSTAVVLLAWMLTILLRNNSARVRYAIWLFASIKFLLPFQLLTYAGAHWSQPVRSNSAQFYAVVEEFTRPLRQAPIKTAPATTSASSFHNANVIWALIGIVCPEREAILGAPGMMQSRCRLELHVVSDAARHETRDLSTRRKCVGRDSTGSDFRLRGRYP